MGGFFAPERLKAGGRSSPLTAAFHAANRLWHDFVKFQTFNRRRVPNNNVLYRSLFRLAIGNPFREPRPSGRPSGSWRPCSTLRRWSWSIRHTVEGPWYLPNIPR